MYLYRWQFTAAGVYLFIFQVAALARMCSIRAIHLLLLPVLSITSATHLTINTSVAISEVESFFLSYTLDQYLLENKPRWALLDFTYVFNIYSYTNCAYLFALNL